jgi:Predicted metal-binding integral membrane protein (DUF2182)
MWAITMVVMMLPSAAPIILLVTALGGDRTAPAAVPFGPIYLLVWIGFSVAATAPQFGLDRSPAGTGCHQRTLSVWIRDMPPMKLIGRPGSFSPRSASIACPVWVPNTFSS